MIIRIVRMEFQQEKIVEFHQIFDESKASIRSFPGCLHLILHQDAHNSNVRYTYSHWESEAHLEAYRKSTLFGKVWPRTKQLFSAKPLAYSLRQLEEVQ
ncbi:MAG: antibiotic biosynthesis monooxygenase family protein [Bacteroidota bacterium]